MEVDEKAQFLSLETTLRMYWRDERINGNPLGGEEFVNVNGKAIDLFWVPDIFIDHAAPKVQYDQAGLNARHIVAAALGALGVAEVTALPVRA